MFFENINKVKMRKCEKNNNLYKDLKAGKRIEKNKIEYF